jgi:Legume lectin domain/Chitobiase/beta-hexosaminidase C-terminal domain
MMYQERRVKVSNTLSVLIAIAMLAVCKVASAGATLAFNYPNGFAGSSSAINLAGHAALSGSVIELTTTAQGHSAGAAWYVQQQNISSFTTDFTFSISSSAANGMTFCVQNSNASTQNPQYQEYGDIATADANGMGYGGYAPSINPLGTAIYNSIAIAFGPQPQNNSGNSLISTSLTALYLEGAPFNPMAPQQDMLPFGVNLASGHTMAAHVVYDGTILTMVIKDTTTLAQARFQWPVNIPVMMAGSGIPAKGTGSSNLAWVGFTGSIVSGANQNLYTWDFYEGYNTRLATPTFSLASGQYSGAQTVTLTGPAGASIYYTTNGLLPTSASTLYTGPISVPANAVIQAVAIQSGFTDSYVGASTYEINTPNVINFPGGFASGDGVALSGSAALSGSQIQLTNTNSQGLEAGAAWFGVPVNIGTFSTAFTLDFTNANANGMTFSIQNQSQGSAYVANSVISGGPDALGASQSGMGYAGIMASVALAFDLYNVPNSVGLYTNGATPTGSQIATGLSFGSGHPFNVSLSYNGTTLSMTMTDTVTKASFSKSWAINIPTTVGGNTAYVGFTGATGGLFANQDVSSWTYSTSTSTVSPAVPAAPTNLRVQ